MVLDKKEPELQARILLTSQKLYRRLHYAQGNLQILKISLLNNTFFCIIFIAIIISEMMESKISERVLLTSHTLSRHLHQKWGNLNYTIVKCKKFYTLNYLIIGIMALALMESRVSLKISLIFYRLFSHLHLTQGNSIF